MTLSVKKLQKYREYLNQRYETFNYVFVHFENINGKVIVELGTTRSFVSGDCEGCMSPDIKYWKRNDFAKWDWGAGCFTRISIECLNHLDYEFHTVDICEDALSISKTVIDDFINNDKIKFHLKSSVEFLKDFAKTNQKIDIIYMDAGETGEDGALLHLDEAKVIVENNLLANNGLILIDDVNLPNSNESKGKYSIPYLLDNGFNIIRNSYQTILYKYII
jgi:hypothetical protein